MSTEKTPAADTTKQPPAFRAAGNMGPLSDRVEKLEARIAALETALRQQKK
jgi:hypothetical protein